LFLSAFQQKHTRLHLIVEVIVRETEVCADHFHP
jgi:hypothetical protein